MTLLMNLMKLFLATLILPGLMLPISAQRQVKKAKNKTQSVTNRLPVISSFTPSLSEIVAPCPWFPTTSGCVANNTCTIILSILAYDPDGDNLLYKYTVTGGQLNNEGSQAGWDLSGLSPGSYTATVEVSDSRGDRVSKSVSVKIVPHGACDGPPCINVSVDCPSEIEEGHPVSFTVNLSGGKPNVNSTFIWAISGGTITKGQGTNTIEVDTSVLGGRQLEATVEVSGLPPECINSASCKVQVRKKTGK